MKFKSVEIKNFRNFENVRIDLDNKNIFFGLNDVGKTNFIAALRFVFDYEIRKNNFVDSDYHRKLTKDPIEIIVNIDIKENTIDTQKLRAQLKGAIGSTDNEVIIRLLGEFDNNELIGIPVLFWGGDLNNLKEMKQKGFMFELDYVFEVIHIDSYVDITALFKKNIKKLLKTDLENQTSDDDRDILNEIDKSIASLNNNISCLSSVKQLEERLKPQNNAFIDPGVEISIKSEIAVTGLFSNIVPYIHQEDDENLYPTSGDGMRKMLAYSVYDILAKENLEKKILLFFIEEPENHLHKSMQILLSSILFTNNQYNYIFLTTHSPYILYEMDNVNLIRIYSKLQVASKSIMYIVPIDYKNSKRILNRFLSEALFASSVLLVEGPSEEILFTKVLSMLSPNFEADGIYILPIHGVGFKPYISILKPLGIRVVVKTDNDLRKINGKNKYSVLGLSRINKCIGKYALPTDAVEENTIDAKRELYDKNQKILDNLRESDAVFLSRVDLENDLYECLGQRLVQILGDNNPVSYLQSSKYYNMYELVQNLEDKDCEEIFNNYNFACLKRVIDYDA
ncbi:ATP-dependent endonuclease [Anaerococcus martiniensis]|uniref:ATP-dependent nuclease n=1 Tax=Anaerococcus sp. WGS1579 TaxID=3366809 RepID=UPI00372D0192